MTSSVENNGIMFPAVLKLKPVFVAAISAENIDGFSEILSRSRKSVIVNSADEVSIIISMLNGSQFSTTNKKACLFLIERLEVLTSGKVSELQ